MKLKCNSNCEYVKNNECSYNLDELELSNCGDWNIPFCNKYKESIKSQKEKFEIISIDNDFLVIATSYINPLEYLNTILEDIKNNFNPINNSNIIFDNLLCVGNEFNRFVVLNYQESISHKYNTAKCFSSSFDKEKKIRTISCKYIKDNNLTKDSILTSNIAKLINKGVII